MIIRRNQWMKRSMNLIAGTALPRNQKEAGLRSNSEPAIFEHSFNSIGKMGLRQLYTSGRHIEFIPLFPGHDFRDTDGIG